jgi:hypothetical protein
MMSHLTPWRAVSAARKGARVAARLPQARRRMAGPPMCPPGAMSGALGPDGAAASIDTARVSIATELAGEGSDNTNSFCECFGVCVFGSPASTGWSRACFCATVMCTTRKHVFEITRFHFHWLS